VADKPGQLVLSALTRAAATAEGLPLHGSRSHPGLFPATTAGKQAAQRCRDEGYLHPLPAEEDRGPRVEDRGSSKGAERCAITDKGLAYLLTQVSPRQVLEDFVRVLEAREAQVLQLVQSARRMQASLEAIRANAEQVLRCFPAPDRAAPAGDLKGLFQAFLHDDRPAPPDLEARLLAHLAGRPAPAPADCPLPELFRHLKASDPALSVGAFHDLLRRLHDAGHLYLHPWTGPLYEIPEPPYALLVGHEVAYYASHRKDEG
jgi:hypothetical protein